MPSIEAQLQFVEKKIPPYAILLTMLGVFLLLYLGAWFELFPDTVFEIASDPQAVFDTMATRPSE